MAYLSSLALGPHPQRALTLMPRSGFAWPSLDIAAGALHWRWGPPPPLGCDHNELRRGSPKAAPPTRTHADASLRLRLAIARHSRRRSSLALGPSSLRSQP